MRGLLIGAMALCVAVVGVACGGGDDSDNESTNAAAEGAASTSGGVSTEGQSSETSAPASSEGEGDDVASGSAARGEIRTATVLVPIGGPYTFTSTDGQCRDNLGGLIVQLELTLIDNEPAPPGAGKFDLELNPDGLEAEDALTVNLPDGQLWAGAAGPAIETPPITIRRGEGLTAGGTQRLVSISGEETVAVIKVVCE